MDSELLFKIALAMTPHVNAQVVRAMCDAGISASDFFTSDMHELSERLSVSSRFENCVREEALFRARRELEFVGRHSVRVLYMLDDDYPYLLREIPDAPVVLYVLGSADLNAQPLMSIVGTRRCTSYGAGFCNAFVSDMAAYMPSATIVSGLAYGIDAAAHIAALENNLKTVAVVAHGLDMIYPASHRDLARRIISSGGAIVSEYPTCTKPFQGRFLERNRIVAGLSELTVVAESEVKGGAMSTASLAFSYSREVVAVPGRHSDVTSSGCNALIARQKAHIYTSVADVMSIMGWKPSLFDSGTNMHSRPLFPELEEDPAKVFSFLRECGMPVSVDEIHLALSVPMPSLMAALTELEFEGIVVKLPGARYELA